MLTEKNIHTTEYRQSDNAGTVAFSSTNYWSTETTYPVDVYDERNDIVKTIVDQYLNYLNTKLTIVTGSLLTYSQAENLDCSGDDYSCENAPSWVNSTRYWTGSAGNTIHIWEAGGDFGDDDYTVVSSYGVRPVITISKSDIQ